MTAARRTKLLGIDGTRLTLDGKPFFLQGLAFFNALYNPNFNRSAGDRLQWLRKFKANGINCLRLWCEWNFPAKWSIFVDVAPEHTMFAGDGSIRAESFQNLAALLQAADSLNMVVEVSMFTFKEKEEYMLPIPVLERGSRELTERLLPYGNLILQIWSEHNLEWKRLFEIIKGADPDRIVTSAPGFIMGKTHPFEHLGDEETNTTLDVLTPHTVRTEAFPFWYLAPAQVKYLLDTYKKPVIDDSPARHGTILYGGIPGGTQPEQHIEHIRQDRAFGGYHNYQHGMMQLGYGNELTPPSGIPDPDFSPFHRKVFDYLRDHPTW